MMCNRRGNVRVFVDCDDTLILFDEVTEVNPYGLWRGDAYRVNTVLVDTLRLACRTCFTLIIWSGGGAKYAKAVSDAVFGDDLGEVNAWLDKGRPTFDLVREEDIVIDDQTLAVRCEQLAPHDIERLRELLHDNEGVTPTAA